MGGLGQGEFGWIFGVLYKVYLGSAIAGRYGSCGQSILRAKDMIVGFLNLDSGFIIILNVKSHVLSLFFIF